MADGVSQRDSFAGEYTIFKKAPWLLPVVWIIRPFYKVLFERESLKRQEISLNTITTENMQSRQQLLNYVGLDYNFSQYPERLREPPLVK